MSKSILVIDTPERCSMCKFLQTTDEKYSYCGILGFDYQVNEYMRSMPEGKPKCCPLRETKIRKMPYSDTDALDAEFIVYYKEGFNAAINEILKEDN